MRMGQSRLRVLGALAAHEGELVANGKGHLPTCDQLAFFGLKQSPQALAALISAIEGDELIEREMKNSRRTAAIRLTEKGWLLARHHGVVAAPTPEPEPEPVVVEHESEPDIVVAARHLLDLALASEHDIAQAAVMGERYGEMASALQRALGEKRQVEVRLATYAQDLRVKEKELHGLRIRLGRVERLLAEAQAVPRDSELYRVKLNELSHLMEERPHVGAGVG